MTAALIATCAMIAMIAAMTDPITANTGTTIKIIIDRISMMMEMPRYLCESSLGSVTVWKKAGKNWKKAAY
jgi:hypothetical protein